MKCVDGNVEVETSPTRRNYVISHDTLNKRRFQTLGKYHSWKWNFTSLNYLQMCIQYYWFGDIPQSDNYYWLPTHPLWTRTRLLIALQPIMDTNITTNCLPPSTDMKVTSNWPLTPYEHKYYYCTNCPPTHTGDIHSY